MECPQTSRFWSDKCCQTIQTRMIDILCMMIWPLFKLREYIQEIFKGGNRTLSINSKSTCCIGGRPADSNVEQPDACSLQVPTVPR